MSNSVQPHRWQPTRLPRPWDSPGKNTGVGCHFLLQCMKVKSEVTQSCPTLSALMDCSLPGSSIHRILKARVLEWVAISFSRGSSDPGIKPRAPSLRADALPSETPGKLHYYLTDFSLFLPSFVLLRSLITETCSREVIASRFRPRNGLGQNPSL